jgi:hypothetical protein
VRRGVGVVVRGDVCVVGVAGAGAGFWGAWAAGAWANAPEATRPAMRQLISSAFRIDSIIV